MYINGIYLNHKKNEIFLPIFAKIQIGLENTTLSKIRQKKMNTL